MGALPSVTGYEMRRLDDALCPSSTPFTCVARISFALSRGVIQTSAIVSHSCPIIGSLEQQTSAYEYR